MTNSKQRRNGSLTERFKAGGLALAVVFSALLVVQTVEAQSYTLLHSFGVRQSDGVLPETGLILDSAGNLYGTTAVGGSHGDGIVFKLDRSGKETILHDFRHGRDDGDWPVGLLRDAAGNFYGATYQGGAYFSGTVFKLDANGVEIVLHSLGGRGDHPLAGVVRDAAGNLYGTASLGGNPACNGGCGIVFKVNTSGKELLLHGFTGSPDGRFPAADLIRDKAGNLYGTTLEGGGGAGIVFKLGPKGFETVLYHFTVLANGEGPSGGLVRDASGNFYGVTAVGGDPTCSCGVVYKLDKSGTLTVLYRFKGGSDGYRPIGTLVRDPAGNLYGATAGGGSTNNGTVFKLDTNGVETILHSFAGFPSDGSGPLAGLARDSAGNLYGTTYQGGTNNGGTAFKLTP